MTVYESQAFIELRALERMARAHRVACHDAECETSLADSRMTATRLAALVLPHEQDAAIALVNVWPR